MSGSQAGLANPSNSERVFLQHYVELDATRKAADKWLDGLWKAVHDRINSVESTSHFTIAEGRWISKPAGESSLGKIRGVELVLSNPSKTAGMKLPDKLLVWALDYRQDIAAFRGPEVMLWAMVNGAGLHKLMANEVPDGGWHRKRVGLLVTQKKRGDLLVTRTRRNLDKRNDLTEVLDDYVDVSFDTSDIDTIVNALRVMATEEFPSLWRDVPNLNT